jgi:hypothetical protein
MESDISELLKWVNPREYDMLTDWMHLKSEAERIRQARIGEVMLFTESTRRLSPFKLGAHLEYPGRHPHFIAKLGVYQGIYDGCWNVPNFQLHLDEKTFGTILNDHGVELLLNDVHGILAPIVAVEIAENGIGLGYGDSVYIGTNEIKPVLHEKGLGHFDRFFEEYMEKYRRIVDTEK